MPVDVLVLNTAVVDFRREDFSFTDKLVGEGGLARCETRDMPDFSQEQLRQWIEQGFAVPGGMGNAAPLIAAAGLRTAVGANLGQGDYAGLDAQGSFFLEAMAARGIDTSAVVKHASLPTGTTFIHSSKAGERLGIVYFPNANDDFDFELFKEHVERLQPSVIYYMYSGLSRRGDANGGRNLAEFMRWCRKDKFRLQHLCQHLGSSEERLNRLFLASTRQTPASFYNRLLLDRACALLGDPEYSVKEIGYQLGFKTCSHFIAAFRREFDATPQEFRKRGDSAKLVLQFS